MSYDRDKTIKKLLQALLNIIGVGALRCKKAKLTVYRWLPVREPHFLIGKTAEIGRMCYLMNEHKFYILRIHTCVVCAVYMLHQQQPGLESSAHLLKPRKDLTPFQG